MATRHITRIIIICLLIVSLGITTVFAQLNPRDYDVSNPIVTLSDDQTTLLISIDVMNNGDDGVNPATVQIFNISESDDTPLIDTTVPALVEDEERTLSYDITTSNFTASETATFQIKVGIDLYELEGTAISVNNSIIVSYTFPSDFVPSQSTSPSNTTQPSNTTTEASQTSDVFFEIYDDGQIRLNDIILSPDEIALIAGIIVFGSLLIWLIWLILGLIFRRPPRYGMWQPPYATVTHMYPDSDEGRRQSWQMIAQNGSLLAPTAPQAFHVIKQLQDAQGTWLANWTLEAMRLSQYDSYGRITHTQSVANRKMIKQFKTLILKHNTWSDRKRDKRIRSIAKQMRQLAKKNMTKKTLFLPLTFDMRFSAKPDKGTIVFELYQYEPPVWRQIDVWQPQLPVVPPLLHEQFSYTIHGQTAGEKPSDFFKRLENDVAWLLMETLRPHHKQVQNQPAPSSPTPETNDVVQEPFDYPDTVAGMTPVKDDPVSDEENTV